MQETSLRSTNVEIHTRRLRDGADAGLRAEHAPKKNEKAHGTPAPAPPPEKTTRWRGDCVSARVKHFAHRRSGDRPKGCIEHTDQGPHPHDGSAKQIAQATVSKRVALGWGTDQAFA